MSNNYWSRTVSRGGLKGKVLRYCLKYPVLGKLLSLRIGTELEIAQLINFRRNSNQKIKMLDIGCGWGTDLAKILDDFSIYGVDIEGAPFSQAVKRGYVEALPYKDDLSIPYEDARFDYVLIKEVCAHVTDEIFAGMLDKAQKLLTDNGRNIVVAELDNNSFSYQLMRIISKNRLEKTILGMDHTNFKTEKEFDRFIEKSGFEINKKSYIVSEIIHFIHFWYFFSLNSDYAFNKTPYKLISLPSLLFDAVASIVNGGLSLIINPENRSFIVFYTLSKNRK